ncbi:MULTISPECIES: hypothetical protein [unclassified Bacillus (in: firmicutes)]|uniref:hypothetical protein n=1 Tax=unclassified Bacillus (in: firmicutes) TaxID=185979 RepID=UPI0008EB335A|nr:MULTISPECIES: hypothetical protein [unclassified Bacillus (in: firmicutes)]SFB09865.1 hypothetical protein SAMN02799634_105303 [Bacillus sp. UNCCL13]SFQ86514.1 hypothetical protein SAMN04488577_2817 [Bacillus sp. cl95]
MNSEQSDSMSHSFHVTKAEREDIKGMLDLNYKIYPEEWHVSEDYVAEIMDKNPEVYNVVKVNDEIKGIYSLFPLNQHTYEGILNGTLEEGNLSEHLLDYDSPKEVYIYFISLIVDIHDPMRKEFAKKIIRDIPKELQRLKEKGIEIKEIGAIAITEEGENVLTRIGFRKMKKPLDMYNNSYPVLRASVDDIIKNIT